MEVGQEARVSEAGGTDEILTATATGILAFVGQGHQNWK